MQQSALVFLFIYLFPFYLTRVALSVSSTALPRGPVNTDKKTHNIGFTRTSINTHTNKQYKYINIKRITNEYYNSRYHIKSITI